MCGVVGAILRDGDIEALRFLQEVMYHSRIRGMHSFGHATCSKKGVKVSRGTLPTNIAEMGKLVVPCLFIGHCRYSTSGITPQPLVLPGFPYTVFAFNGNIHMGTKPEMEKHFGYKMYTDNDGEIFMHLNPMDRIRFISRPSISFAGIWFENNALYVLRNERRPLWCCRMAGGNVFYASTADIFFRAGANALMVEPIEPYRVICGGEL